MQNRDTHVRSLMKGLTWRALATLTTVVIAWIVVGDVAVALEIGAIEVQASKLQQQLEMASHAIALLTAARDRETEE